MAYESPTVTLLGLIIYRAEQDSGFTVVGADYWILCVDERANGTFDAHLVAPDGDEPYSSHLRATADEAIEKACDYLRDQLKQPGSAAALRTLALVEIRSAQ